MGLTYLLWVGVRMVQGRSLWSCEKEFPRAGAPSREPPRGSCFL